MALPGLIRLFAAATLCLFFWLVLQIFRAPHELAHKVDEEGKPYSMLDEPNLDREIPSSPPTDLLFLAP